MLERIFLRFYCLDIWAVVGIMLSASVIYLVLRRVFEHRRWWRGGVRSFCILFCWLLVTVTVVSREMDIIEPQLVPFASYIEVLSGGNRELIRSNFMNVVLFFPQGLLLCDSLPKRLSPLVRFAVAAVICLAGSVVIELSQYMFALGKCETDDVIHNVLGALAGAGVSLIRVFDLVPLGDKRTERGGALKKHEKLFLSVIKGALCQTEPNVYGDITKEDWQKAVYLAREQKLLSMFVDKAFSCTLTPEIPNGPALKMEAIGEVAVQAIKARELDVLLKLLCDRGLHPIVVKGAVVRPLYPNPDKRQSTDEDILVSESEFVAAQRVLCEFGMEPTGTYGEDSFEIGYRKKGSPLYVELHRALFAPDAAAFRSFLSFFENWESYTAEYEVQKGKAVSSLSPHDHMLYLILHAYKHFVHSGFGIRQAADIGMWAEAYYDRIDWDRLYRQCERADALVFSATVMELSRIYLGRGPLLCDKWKDIAAPAGPMLCDMLSGGIYGSADLTRQHSATVTLGALEADRAKKKSSTAASALFLPKSRLVGRYPYLNKYPWLLPVAWAARIFGYAGELLSKKKNSNARKSLQIARARVGLLRYYNIIK